MSSLAMPTPPPDASPAEISIVESSENEQLGIAADVALWPAEIDLAGPPGLGDVAPSGEIFVDSDEYIDLLQGLANAGEPSGTQSIEEGLNDAPINAAVEDSQPEAEPSTTQYIDAEESGEVEGYQASSDPIEPDDDQAYPDHVADGDRTFFGLLIQDLKECIDEPAWTLKLWSDVFTSEYGWDPNVLLDKYFPLVEDAVPAFAQKMAAAEDDDVKPDSASLKEEQSERRRRQTAYDRVLEELRAWNWDDPNTSSAEFQYAYIRKYGVSPGHVLAGNRARFYKLVPSYGARMKANRGAGPKKRHPIEALEGVVSRSFKAVHVKQLTMFNKVLEELRAWDWTRADTSYEDWRSAYILKYGRTPDRMMEGRQGLFRELVPAFDAHCVRKDAGTQHETVDASVDEGDWHHRSSRQESQESGLETVDISAPRQLSADGVRPQHQQLFDLVLKELRAYDWTNPDARQQAWTTEFRRKHGEQSQSLGTIMGTYGRLLRRLVPEYGHRMEVNRRMGYNAHTSKAPSPMRSPLVRHVPSPRSTRLDPSVRQQILQKVSPAYRDLFDLAVTEINKFDWSRGDDPMAQFLDDFRVKHRTNVFRLFTQYGTLMRRCCPKYAARMDADRLARGANGPSPQTLLGRPPRPPRPLRLGNSSQAQSSDHDSDVQVLSRFPSPKPATVRPAPYVQAPRPRQIGPLSFASALAALEVEAYHHQSAGALLPQLPSVAEYLSTSAQEKYAKLVDRVRELDPLIETKLAELRGTAREVDALQSAIAAEWETLQAAGATSETAMDVDGQPPKSEQLKEWEARQFKAVERRNILLGQRTELDHMREERTKCFARIREIDEVVVRAKAKVEAALMSDDE